MLGQREQGPVSQFTNPYRKDMLSYVGASVSFFDGNGQWDD